MKRWLLAMLALLLTSQTACLAPTDARATIRSQLAQPDSVWAKALPAQYRGELSKYADAPVHRYQLTYDPETRKLSGTAEILFTNTTDHPLPALIMRTWAKQWGDEADSFSLTDLKVNDKRADLTMRKTLITVPLAQPLAPGESVRMTYAATVRLPKLNFSVQARFEPGMNVGLYGVGPDLTTLGGFPALIPNGEADKLYDIPPKNDFPELNTADLDEIWLTLPADWMVIPQGTLLEETPAKNGQKTAHIVAVSQISEPGGMVLITNRMTRRVAKAGDIEVRTYTDIAITPFADEIMKEVQGALQTYQTIYGPVPLQKLDVVLMPMRGAAGALLGGGLIPLWDQLAKDDRGLVDMYLSRPAKLVVANDKALYRRRIIYHEVAHAWWADLVGADTPAETWLTEAMAEASTFYASEQLDGVDGGDTARLTDIANYWQQRAAGMKDAPIGLPLPQYDSLQQRNVIFYHKGSLYFDQLRKTVGDDKFFAAMRTYLKEHAFTVIHEPGPTAALLGEPGVQQLYTRWVKETHGDEDIGSGVIHDKDFRAVIHLPAE